MSVAYTDIQGLASEFASLSQSYIEARLARALRRLNEAFWGDLYDDATLYLTAHLCALDSAGSSAPAGPVTSKSAGALSIGYAAPPYTHAWYGSTHWGREYSALLETLRYKTVQAI